MPVVGKRTQRFREKLKLVDIDGNFTSRSFNNFSRDSQKVADVEKFEYVKFVGKFFGLKEQLNLAGGVFEVGKDDLPVLPPAPEATGHG